MRRCLCVQGEGETYVPEAENVRLRAVVAQYEADPKGNEHRWKPIKPEHHAFHHANEDAKYEGLRAALQEGRTLLMLFLDESREKEWPTVQRASRWLLEAGVLARGVSQEASSG